MTRPNARPSLVKGAARVSDIIILASEIGLVDRALILGSSRHRRVVRIRQACMKIAREQGHSYPQIGRRMGRDHSTIVHGVEKAENLAKDDARYAAFLKRLRAAAVTAKPCIADRITTALPAPKPVPEPEPAPEPIDHDLSDDELLSRAVAAHYASA